MLHATSIDACASKDTSASVQPSRQQLIEQNTPLALALAHRFRHRNLDREDLEQVAYLALILGVDSFDPTRGSTLGGYLRRCIRRALRKAIRRADLISRPWNGPGQPLEVMSLDQLTAEGDAEDSWDVPEHRPGPDREAASEEGFQALLRGLTAAEKRLVEVVCRENVSLDVAAQRIGWSKQQAERVHVRALGRLRRKAGVAMEPNNKPCETEDHRE